MAILVGPALESSLDFLSLFGGMVFISWDFL